MNIKDKFNLSAAATLLLLCAAACSKSENPGESLLPEEKYPLVIEASGLKASETAAPAAHSRATVDGSWEGNEQVALQVADNAPIYTYTVDASGRMTSENPYYWKDKNDITVTAWYPYAETMPEVEVKADQSTEADFQASDFLAAEAQTVSFAAPRLVFAHRTARLTLTITSDVGGSSIEGAKVSVLGLTLKKNGIPTDIITFPAGSDRYEALLVPQIVAQGVPFIKVEMNNKSYTAKLSANITLEAGKRYSYKVTVKSSGVEINGCSISGWESDPDYAGETGSAEQLDYLTSSENGVTTYTVYTVKGLQEWATAAQANLATNCILGADITLPAPEVGQSNWTPVGGYGSPYTGTFDGANYTISNLTIVASSDYQGLFGTIDNGAQIRNLNLKNVNISGVTRVGGIAGAIESGTIANCTVSGHITSNSNSYVGGITGQIMNSDGRLFGCQVIDAEISGRSSLGGVIGANAGTLVACSAVCTISATSASGGVSGPNSGRIIACWFSGTGPKNAITSYNSNTVTACYWDTFEGSAIGGYGSSQAGTTKVDGTDVTWATAIEAMNTAIETWNTENTENPCNYRFTAGEEGRPVIE